LPTESALKLLSLGDYAVIIGIFTPFPLIIFTELFTILHEIPTKKIRNQPLILPTFLTKNIALNR
jgi:hypothetical protein